MERLSPTTPEPAILEVEGESVPTSGPDPSAIGDSASLTIGQPIRPTVIILAPSTIHDSVSVTGDAVPPLGEIKSSDNPLTSDAKNRDSSETDTADEGGSSTDTAFSGDEPEPSRKRPRLSDPQDGVPVASKSGEQVSSESALLVKPEGRNKDSSETDTADEGGSSTDSAPSPSDDEQPTKRLRMSENDPKICDPVSTSSDELVSLEKVKLKKTEKENVDSRYIDISGDSDSASSISDDGHEKQSRESVPSASDNLGIPKTDGPIPSTSGQSVRPKIRDPVPSTSAQNIPLRCDEHSEEIPIVYNELKRLIEKNQQPQEGGRVPRPLHLPESGVDSCEESPDEEIHSQAEKTERNLDENAMRESVQKVVEDSGAAIKNREEHREISVFLKENAQEEVQDYQEEMIDMDDDSMVEMNSHLQLYLTVLRRWEVMYQKLVDRIQTAQDLRKSLMKRLSAMAGERMNFNEAEEIYDTIDNLNGLLKYTEALLRCLLQRTDLLETIKNKVRFMRDEM